MFLENDMDETVIFALALANSWSVRAVEYGSSFHEPLEDWELVIYAMAFCRGWTLLCPLSIKDMTDNAVS